MLIRNITNKEIEPFAKSIVSETSFKDTLLSWMKNGITKLEWCFVVEDNNTFLGGIVFGAFDNELEILNINIKDADEIQIYDLLQSSLHEMKLKGFTEIGCHLYSDKDYFKKYVESFIKTGFKITQKKKSFIWEKGNNINKVSKRLVFKSLGEVGSNKYIEAIEKVTVGTLDQDDLDCVKKYGDKQAAINYFNELKDIDFNKNWWELAYTLNDELIGLVIPQKFDKDHGAINYIGVVPKKRGNGYINDLLREGIRILSKNNIKKVIADIDVNNYPLEKVLYKEGFKLDCRMLVLKINL